MNEPVERQKFEEIRFTPYNGDLMGLPTNEHHIVYKLVDDNCKILFSMTRQGNAASCHVASDKQGLRLLKTAINEFCGFVFVNHHWCEMIIAKVGRPSIMRLLVKCKFKKVWNNEEAALYVRRRHGIR